MSIYSMDNLMIGAPPLTTHNPILRANRSSASPHQRYNSRTPNIMVMGQDPNAGVASMPTVSISSPRSPRLKLTPASPDNAGPALARLGKSIALSVEMLATVGETVGDENPEIRGDMLSACRESRAVSGALEKLCESLSRGPRGLANAPVAVLLHAPTPPPAPAPSGSGLPPEADLEALLRTLRRLLVSVTQILLLADNVVVKQLLTISKDKGPACDLNTMSTMHHFTEFVKAFCDFGSEMNSTVRIATGEEETSPKEERRRVQIDCARTFLARSATLLLTSAKVFQRYPDSLSARENRDTVFCQMRRALDLIHYIVKESVTESTTKFGFDLSDLTCGMDDDSEMAGETNLMRSIHYFEGNVEIIRMGVISDGYKEQLTRQLDTIVERTQDFTDSAYTSHDRRQHIIMHCERAKLDLTHLLRSMAGSTGSSSDASGVPSAPLLIDLPPPSPRRHELEQAMRILLKTTGDLKSVLQRTALELAGSLVQTCRRRSSDLLDALADAALSADVDRLQVAGDRMTEHVDYVEDVAKLVRNVAWTESSNIRARHAQINLKIYGPQLVNAASTLCKDPRSKLAKDNLDAFSDVWQQLVDDVVRVTERVAEHALEQQRLVSEQSQTQVATSKLMPPSVPYSPLRHRRVDEGAWWGEGPAVGGGFASKFLHKSVPDLSGFSDSCSAAGNSGPPGEAGGLGPFLSHPESMAGDPRLLNGDLLRRHSTSGLPGHPQLQQQHFMPPFPHGNSSMTSSCMSRRPEDLLNAFKDVDNNDIIKRAKKMAVQANDMYDFTRGQGKVKTTQDLFTLAEYFAEETNIIYKVIRLFSYDVPSGEDKRALMAIADHVPKRCQQLQQLIQSSTVGKAATFTKVDSIIRESRQIINLVVTVAQMCYANANKYNLDFSNVSLEGRTTGGDDNSQPFGSSSAGGSGATSGSDSS